MSETRANTNRAEIAPVGGQNLVHLSPFRYGGHDSVDKPEAELQKPGV
jgi:hypothetical protein